MIFLTIIQYILLIISMMWLLYVVGIQFRAGGICYALLPVTLIAWILDVILNYSIFALGTWDWPQGWHEVTFSQRLSRLIRVDSWKGSLSRFIAFYMLDPFDPSGKHIR